MDEECGLPRRPSGPPRNDSRGRCPQRPVAARVGIARADEDIRPYRMPRLHFIYFSRNSSAGMALENQKPWALSQPTARMMSTCSRVSMPSQMT